MEITCTASMYCVKVTLLPENSDDVDLIELLEGAVLELNRKKDDKHDRYNSLNITLHVK